MKETTRRWLLRALKLVLTLAATYFLFRSLSVSWGQLREVDPEVWTPHLLPLTAAAGLAVASLLYTIVLWARLVQVLGGPRLNTITAVSVYMVSSLARYIPGKLWQVASLAYLASRAGVSATIASSAALLGHLLNLGAAVVVAGIALGLGNLVQLPRSLSLAALAVAVLVAGAIGVPSVLRALLRLAFRLGRESSPLPVLDTLFGVRWIAFYAPAWIGFGSGFALLWASVPGVPAADWTAAVGIFAAAYFVGYAALFAPAGLGVREGVMALLLAPWIGAAPAVIFSVMARVWLTVSELLPFLALIPRWLSLAWVQRESSS